jgi:hypothetical protein
MGEKFPFATVADDALSRAALIKIMITQAAFDAIAKTLTAVIPIAITAEAFAAIERIA